jgi:hypothetical protein
MEDFTLQMRALWLAMRPIGVFGIAFLLLLTARYAAAVTVGAEGDSARGWRIVTIAMVGLASVTATIGAVDFIAHTINPMVWLGVFNGEAAQIAFRRGWL